jgi:hypothetical protein
LVYVVVWGVAVLAWLGLAKSIRQPSNLPYPVRFK